jgi:lipid II:glycine glycyltransferase (peptidoglycan interpeptide bridge formation enzyme)
LTGRRFVSLPFSDHCDPLVDGAGELDEMLAHIKRKVDNEGWKYVEIRPASCEPGCHTGLERSARYCVHRLDMRPNPQELFRAFHKDCVQRKIRRAEREKLNYEEGNSEELLQAFYRLLVLTRRRQFLPPQPIAWFRGLIAAFGSDLKLRVASKDGVAVASILTLSHRKSMVYKYGCSDADANRFGGTPLLFWRTIEEAKDRGFEVFDLGRSDLDNLGLIAFKDHWGAQKAMVHYWTYPMQNASWITSWQKSMAKQVVSASPDRALITLGKLMYRHIA